jgi:hypothetical protein
MGVLPHLVVAVLMQSPKTFCSVVALAESLTEYLIGQNPENIFYILEKICQMSAEKR